MNSRQRFLAAIRGEQVDRVPVGSVTSVATVDQMEQTGAYFPDVHLDGEKMARLAAGAIDILGFDCAMPYFSVSAEAAALGCEIDWGDKISMPMERTHPWSDPEQVCIPKDFLEQPSTATVLQALQLLKKAYGERAAIVGKVMGPWTLAYHMHGVQDFLMATILEPEKVNRFLERLMDVTILFANAQIAAGADVICVADHATGDLVSGRMYRDLLLPFHKQLTSRLNFPLVLHICGNTLDRIEYIAFSGFHGFHFDSKVDAKKAIEKVNTSAPAGQRLALLGNVNNPETLLNGKPEAAYLQAKYAIAAGVAVVGPECAVPLLTPLENLRAIRQAVVDMTPS
jgi:[methyl-Co(III) methanol-specific corrinoid protein]:coenzyme M methyltransferase